MGELDGLRESRNKGNDTLKAAKLKYSVQVCFLRGTIMTLVKLAD